MGAIVADTSAWIRFLDGESIPSLESALKEARVILSPIVLAELMSKTRNGSEQNRVADLTNDLILHETPRSHWVAVGELRRTLKNHQIRITIPDAHIAQCAIDENARLLTYDKIFVKISRWSRLRLATPYEE